MTEILNSLLASNFMPHGYCLLWDPPLIGLHVVSDVLIGLAYYSIPAALVRLVQLRDDLAFNWIFLMFGAFIFACGTTHLIAVLTLWVPAYWLEGVVKLLTALISVATAILVWPLIPKVLALRSPAQLEQLNRQLENDIRERRRVEAALRESEQRYHDLFDNAHDIIQSVGPDGRFQFVNRAWLEILGYTPDDLKTLTLVDILHPSCRQHCEAVFQQVISGKPQKKVPATFVAKDGRAIDVEGNITARVLGNTVLATQAIFRDVTEEKRAVTQLSRLSNAVTMSIDGIVLTDAQGRMTEVNEATLSMYGTRDLEDLVGKSSFELIAPEDRDTAQAGMLEVLEKGFIKNREYHVIAKDGRRIAVEMSVALMQEENGPPLGFVGVIRDVTEREQAETALQDAHQELERRVQERTRALQETNNRLRIEIAERQQVEAALQASEARYRSLVETSPDAIVLTDLDFSILLGNQRAAELCGVSQPAALVGRQTREFLSRTEPSALQEMTQQLRTTGHVEQVEGTVISPAGASRLIEASLSVIKDSAGQPVGYVGVARDITERKAVERLKDELMATVSHELRTPLASLRGFAELMLERTFSPAEQREFLGIIHTEALRLTNLINDFLDLQRLEAGQQRYDREPCELGPLVAESVAVFRHGGQHTLRLALADRLPRVWMDAEQIQRVVTNLLSNALKFSPQGGVVEVGARVSAAEVVVWVRDEGVGIPAAAQGRLFERFYRVESEATQAIGGTGLGLALVKEIVAAHGGRVWVESVEGHGATFFFSLPGEHTGEEHEDNHISR